MMSRKHGPKRTSDHLTHKAKKEGYPARSVYKLEEIQQKYSVIGKKDRVLDIGAAPGSWSLYVSKLTEGGVVSVDLNPLDGSIRKKIAGRINNALFIEGDIFDESVRRQLTQAGPYDCIISDAAPSTTGNRTVDAGRSYSLVTHIIEASTNLLHSGGNMVVKVFQGGDEKAILDLMKDLFVSVKAHKPKASRKPSFETYYIGKGKR